MSRETGRASILSPPSPVVHTLRSLVFVPGFLFGLFTAATAALFGGGGGPMYVRQARVWVPLVIALAAPFLWVLAQRRGDRWTLAYVGIWVTFVAITYTLVWAF